MEKKLYQRARGGYARVTLAQFGVRVTGYQILVPGPQDGSSRTRSLSES